MPKNNFVVQLYRKRHVPAHYRSISYFDKLWENPNTIKTDGPKKELPRQLHLVPEYFDVEVNTQLIGRHVIHQNNWGYAIKMDFDSVEEYLTNQFKSKYRSIIRRYVKRLETCFDIEYTFFFGDITLEEYQRTMNVLKDMIDRRFDQRKERHKALVDWNEIYDEAFPLILSKKASLFIIYADGHPIEISLNYHFDTILFSSISSYDIDYSKFGLGHIEIYKQLEWCLENGYSTFEMGVGGMDYKRRWSNFIYQFENHITFSKNSVFQKVYASVLKWILSFKEYLKSKNINDFVYALMDRFFTLVYGDESTSRRLKAQNTPQLDFIEDLPKNIESMEPDYGTYPFLKKVVCDYLYTTVQSKKDISFYREKGSPNVIYIKGQKNALIPLQQEKNQ